MQPAVCSLQSAVCSLRSAVCSLQSAVCSLQMSYTAHKSRSDGGHFDFHIVKGTRGEWKRAEFKNPWGVGTLDG